MEDFARRRLRRGAATLLALATGIAVLALPAVASAQEPGTYWVNGALAPVGGDGTSCSSPGFSTIQAAVDAEQVTPSGTIKVCPGTYAEQVQVTGSTNLTLEPANRHLGAVIQLPATPADSTTSCDTAPGTGAYQPDQDGFVVCGSRHTFVHAEHLTFDEAWPAATCDDSLYGILVGGHSTLKLTQSAIVAAGAIPINGCQGGVAVQVGMAWTTPNEAGTAILSNDSIAGYQKNGVTVDGTGSYAQFWEDTIEGAGPTTQTAQNGIQVSNGALATITRVTVTGNECNAPSCGPNAFSDYQAAGVLFYGAKRGSLLTDSTIEDNDIGVYYASTSPTLPPSTEVGVTFDQVKNNRDEGLLFDQGRVAVANTKVRGGNVGILLLQYLGQAYGVFPRVTTTNVRGQSVAAIQVLSDQAAGDRAGAATFTNCPISGAVLSNSSTFALTFRR